MLLLNLIFFLPKLQDHLPEEQLIKLPLEIRSYNHFPLLLPVWNFKAKNSPIETGNKKETQLFIKPDNNVPAKTKGYLWICVETKLSSLFMVVLLIAYQRR